jgi:glycosyltransferase involved in cell wall biosynthesis
MTVRPRLLVLAQGLPYPPHSGVANRTFNVLKQLQVAYDVALVPFSRANHQPDRAERSAAWRALQRIADVVAEPTPIPNEQSRARKIWDHLRSIVSGRAYTYYEYESRTFAEQLRAVVRVRPPDLIHLDSLDLHRWLPDLPHAPIAATHHNLESELLRRYALGLTPALLRAYVRLQADRLEDLERRWCPRLALNVMVSDVDARRLRTLAPGAATTVVPNGTDTEYFQRTGDGSVAGRVAFVGPTYSHPNRDAVEVLLRDIWPLVLAADRSAALQLIGRNAPADAARYAAQRGVTPLGHVPDIRPVLAAARCCVVPIRIGGGTRLKILDAWAMGKATVSTSIGCEGLDAVDGENILVRDTPEAFAEAVVQVLRDAPLRAHLEGNARRTAVETYSWSVVGRRLRAAYGELLGYTPDATDSGVAAASEAR